MQNDDLNHTTITGQGRERTGPMLLGVIAILVVLALVWMWAPWSDNTQSAATGKGTTTGSSSARPGAPMPQAAPASPTTNR
jgi:ferric-dicitrate binding protein FerR (iron transport regulator)